MAYFCPNCGEPVRNADKFCQACGYKLTDEPVDVDVLRHTNTVSSGNVQYQETEYTPVEAEERSPYEEYLSHTYDHQREQKADNYRQYQSSRNSYGYQRGEVEYFTDPSWPVRSRIAAGLFAILMGGLGVHKFYLNKIGEGILMLLFSWTGIPYLIGLIQGIIYLTQSDEEFSVKNKVRTQ